MYYNWLFVITCPVMYNWVLIIARYTTHFICLVLMFCATDQTGNEGLLFSCLEPVLKSYSTIIYYYGSSLIY